MIEAEGKQSSQLFEAVKGDRLNVTFQQSKNERSVKCIGTKDD